MRNRAVARRAARGTGAASRAGRRHRLCGACATPGALDGRQREAGVVFDRYVVLASLFQPRDLRLMVTMLGRRCPRWASLLIGL